MTQFQNLQCERAYINLLIADSMMHPSQLNEKAKYYKKAVEIYYQKPFQKQKQRDLDEYTILLKIQQNFAKFCIKALKSEKIYVQLAALRALEFLIESVGCSLGLLIPFILEKIVIHYPKKPLKLKKHPKKALKVHHSSVDSLDQPARKPLEQDGVDE